MVPEGGREADTMRALLISTTFFVMLAGPPGSLAANFDEDTFGRKSIPAYSIPTPERGAPPAETVIGQVRPYRIRKGDTLIDLARYYDLGYNEIVDANPGIDPWVPPAGATILLPTQWVLPCCTYDGIVVNIPEMRLFFYRRAAGDPHTTIVYTYPVGLGRDDWRTPSATIRASSFRAARPTTRSASTASSSPCRSTASTGPTSRGGSGCR